jgi:hypothetical protein
MLRAQNASLPVAPKNPVVEHDKKNKKGNESENIQQNNPSPIAPASAPNQAQPNSQKDDGNTPSDDRIHKVNVVALPVDWLYRLYVALTFAAVIVGGITARAVWRQMQANEVSAKAALVSAQAVMNAERAWILIMCVGDPIALYLEDNPAYIPGIVYEFKVTGHSPARIIRQGFRFHPVRKKPGDKAEPDLPPVPDYGDRTKSTDIPVKEDG